MSDLSDVATCNGVFAATLVDEWVRGGLRHAVVAPGSRSTPLALALLRETRVEVQTVLDERSAAFRALGIAKATGAPTAVLSTSGTAAANFTPAVFEAHQSRAPLLVLTADRPPELHGVGAPQTMDQTGLYGSAPRAFVDPGPPEVEGDDDPTDVWRSLAARAIGATLGRVPGPVHCNLAFREPLLSGARIDPLPGRADGSSWEQGPPSAPECVDGTGLSELVDLLRHHERGLIVAGWGTEVDASDLARLSDRSGWPILADLISGLRGPETIAAADVLARHTSFRSAHAPEVVLRLGAPPTSKALLSWLGALEPPVTQVLIDPYDVKLDPSRSATRRLVVDERDLVARLADSEIERARDVGWASSWRDAERVVRAGLDDALEAGVDDRYCIEAGVARTAVAATPADGVFAVASSMPVRDVDTFSAGRRDLRVLSNRGVNGIDGFVSTVVGAAAGSGRPTVALLGDLCFLHDVNGLLNADSSRAPVVFVVVDNDGGGIFDFLPQRDLLGRDEYERAFGTPHGLDLVAVARAHGVGAARVELPELAAAIEIHAGGDVHVLVVPSDRATNLSSHRALHDRITRALDALFD